MTINDGGASGDAGGSGTVERPAWLDSAPDAYKNNEAFYGFTEPAKFYEKADALLKAEKDMVVVPGENATDEQRQAFYTKLGRPETADKYTITKPADLPDGVPYSPEVEAVFKDQVHKLGLTNAQAKAQWDWYFGMTKTGFEKSQQAEQQATEAAVNKLKDEWKGEDFKVNSELAARAFMQFGGKTPEVEAFFKDTKVNGVQLGNHPTFLRVFAAIGKAISDDSLNGGRGAGGSGEKSDEEQAKALFPNTKWTPQQ